MKKIMLLALVFISVNAFAQEKKGDHQRKNQKEMHMQKSDLTPEQQATLLTKRLTLKLDLSETQQKEIYDLNVTQAFDRLADREAMKKAKETGKKPTEQERYDRMVERLDKQILIKNQMKSILKSDQYAVWEKDMSQHKRRGQKRGEKAENGPDRERRS
ncbi:hypothetical protein [Formosa sp. 4Alg 33]|uniref:hypothetical protein n=1 Tax=Formosa sp. 4Alg 33 TaxID=3382189 RepID=UPI003D9C0CCC